MYRLSLLDQSPVFPTDTPKQALERTVQMAKLAERAGFHRFWVSEHHQARDVAGTAPEILVTHLLAHTSTIRIGSGGVMLSHYSPYKVAEVFRLLATLYPGRVDLGVGTAPGGLPLATKALRYEQHDGTPVAFEKRLEDLQKYVLDTHEIVAEPIPTIPPELILLGGSVESAKQAARLHIPYTFAQFINNDEAQLEEAVRSYKAIYPEGSFAVAVAVIAAETLTQAKELATNTDLYRIYFEDGSKFTLQSESAAEKFGQDAQKPYRIERVASTALLGTPTSIFNQFDAWHALGVDEFIVHNPIQQERARFESIERIAEQYNVQYAR